MGRREDPKRTSLPITCTCLDLENRVDLTQSPAGTMGGEAVPVWKRIRAPAFSHGAAFPGARQGLLSHLSRRRRGAQGCWLVPKQTTLLSLLLLIPACSSDARNMPAMSWKWLCSGLGGFLKAVPSLQRAQTVIQPGAAEARGDLQ